VFRIIVIGGGALAGLLMTILFTQLEEDPRLGWGGLALVVFGQPVVTSRHPAHLPVLLQGLAGFLTFAAGGAVGWGCCCLIDANLQRRLRVAVTGDNGSES
jgi:hypothetical protein